MERRLDIRLAAAKGFILLLNAFQAHAPDASDLL